jgi:hypothetical protein
MSRKSKKHRAQSKKPPSFKESCIAWYESKRPLLGYGLRFVCVMAVFYLFSLTPIYRQALSGLLYGVAFVIVIFGIVSFIFSTKLKELKQKGPHLDRGPIGAMIASLSDFCKRARSEGRQAGYEWSI